MSLTPGNHSLVPGRVDRYQVILAASLFEALMQAPQSSDPIPTNMNLPSGDHAMAVSEPKYEA